MSVHSPHRILIVGGGAGGLELACRLGRKARKSQKAAVTLVDENLTHVWKPLLHEVAAGSLDTGIEAADYLALGRRHGFRFRLGRMEGLNRKNKTIRLASIGDDQGKELIPAASIGYDILVLAVGSRSNDYGITGVRRHCLFLDTREQADRFHHTLLNRFLQLQYQDTSETRDILKVAIIGAGATGVELAAELHNAANRLASFGFDHLPSPKPIQLALIEGADRILPALPDKVAAAAVRELHKNDVAVHTGSMVASITTEGVKLQNGSFIAAHIKVWAAGIKAPDYLKDLDGLEANTINQLVVHPNLGTTRDDAIFAFGDCAACPRKDSQALVPPRSQAAHQQARLLVHSLMRRIERKPLPDFVYRDHGSLVHLSRSAVGRLMGNLTGNWFIEGRLARLIYHFLYRSHQWSVHGPRRTFLIMISDFLTRRARPRFKLH